MTPEEKARKNIDKLLKSANWTIQNRDNVNLGESLGVAIREFTVETGRADYILYVDRKAIGVVEAKKEGSTLSSVSEQSEKYQHGIPDNIPHYQLPLPFAYESTGIETQFTDLRDPEPRQRHLFAFHKPDTLLEWIEQGSSLRNRLQQFPLIEKGNLYDCQFEAITNLEESFAKAHPRALIQMATGTGKTYTSVSFVYRLIKFAKAKRVLFLVDRGNLGRQTLKEFQQYVTPDDGRKFNELYNVQYMKTNTIDDVSKVCITTIQRLFSMLKGDTEYDPDNEEGSMFTSPPVTDQPVEIGYNPKIPIEKFDFIITDECHRSIYNLWRQVLEYFDAFIIGLTATPSKQTLGFFNKNLVMEYDHSKAVADNVNVDYDTFKIWTRITAKGSTVETGNWICKRNKLTRDKKWEQLDEDFDYSESDLDRSVVAKDQIRTIIQTFKDKLFTELFPGRQHVPKTLIFAKTDSHAEDIVHITREVFGKGNEFCKKITYKSTDDKPENLINDLRTSYNLRIAVTVDMIATGTDIKPLECIIFMRDVKSRLLFEQMVGRGTRTISKEDYQQVTPDSERKTHFLLIDAVGVLDCNFIDPPIVTDVKKSVPLEKLFKNVSVGIRDDDTLSTIASRLTRLDKILKQDDKSEIEEKSDGVSLKKLVADIVEAIKPDSHIDKAKELYNTETPSDGQIKKAREKVINEACTPLDKPEVREIILTIKRKHEQAIDEVSVDEVLEAGFSKQAQERAKSIIGKFKLFLEDNKDEITALQIFYSQPYGKRHLTLKQIKELAQALERPPLSLSTEVIWNAYEKLEKARVHSYGPDKLLTNIISLLRFSLEEVEILEPYKDSVDARFEKWVGRQKVSGKEFNEEQLKWLTLIKDHIATSLSIDMDDFELSPFYGMGGQTKVFDLFGKETNEILNELNDVLAA